MSAPAANDLKALLHLAALHTSRAQAEIAAANKRIAALGNEISDLDPLPDQLDPTVGFAFGKWLVWRDVRQTFLNRELALARAEAARITKIAARAIAREEALKLLLSNTVNDMRLDKERRRTEALASAPTSPDA